MVPYLKNDLKPSHVRANSYLCFSTVPKEEKKVKNQNSLDRGKKDLSYFMTDAAPPL